MIGRETLETLQKMIWPIGPLADLYPTLDPDTIKTAPEITKARVEEAGLRGKLSYEVTRAGAEEAGLRGKWFWTANLGVYRRNIGSELEYGLGAGKTFNAIAGQNIGEFCRQLTENSHYKLRDEQVQELDELAQEIMWVNPSGLELQEGKPGYSYFEVDTADYNKLLNPTQRMFAERVYGAGRDFINAMGMLHDDSILSTRLIVPSPDYVERNTENGTIIAGPVC